MGNLSEAYQFTRDGMDSEVRGLRRGVGLVLGTFLEWSDRRMEQRAMDAPMASIVEVPWDQETAISSEELAELVELDRR